MITEVAILNLKTGNTDEFEDTFSSAVPIIQGTAGYISHELIRCIETQERYLLIVRWETLEAHTVGFRGSPQYQEWKRLLHHYYEPYPPLVEHYESV